MRQIRAWESEFLELFLIPLNVGAAAEESGLRLDGLRAWNPPGIGGLWRPSSN
jgi:hypothetical protein